MSHEAPWDLVTKILAWNNRYAAEAVTVAARRRLLTDAHAAAAAEIRQRGGTWADVESFLNMAPGRAGREYGPLIESAVEALDTYRLAIAPEREAADDDHR